MKVVGRAENIVTPVEGDDIFPILHRRLFTTIGAEHASAAVPLAHSPNHPTLASMMLSTTSAAGPRLPRSRSLTPTHFTLNFVDILANRWGSFPDS